MPSYSPFDLVLTLPVPQGVRLVDSPYSLDSYAYTENSDGMNFWFKDLHVVRVPDQTSIVVRVTQSDAANLDYLLSLDPALSFIPGSGLLPVQPGYYAMSLPATSVLEDGSRVDLLFVLPETKQADLVFPETFDEVFSREMGDTLEFWLDNVRVSVSSDLIATFAAKPADVANLQYLIEQGAQVNFTSDDSAPALIDRGYVALALPASEPMPDTQQVDVVIRAHVTVENLEPQPPELDDAALSRITRLNGDMLEYWLRDLRVLNQYEVASLGLEGSGTITTVQVTPTEARAIEYLMEVDREASVQFFAPLSALIDPGKVVVSIPAPADMPDTPQIDILWRTSVSYKQFETDLPRGLNQIEPRINGEGLEFRLTHVERLNAETLRLLNIEPSSDVLTLQVTPQDAEVIEWLVENSESMHVQPSSGQASETKTP